MNRECGGASLAPCALADAACVLRTNFATCLSVPSVGNHDFLGVKATEEVRRAGNMSEGGAHVNGQAPLLSERGLNFRSTTQFLLEEVTQGTEFGFGLEFISIFFVCFAFFILGEAAQAEFGLAAVHL